MRFIFGDDIVESARWNLIWVDFIQKLYDEQHRSKIRFALVGGSKLSRIAMFIQPNCAVGIGLGDRDLLLVIERTTVPNALKSRPVTTAHLNPADFDAFDVFRAILGAPATLGAGPTPLTAADFTQIASFVDVELGDVPGTRSVVAIP